MVDWQKAVQIQIWVAFYPRSYSATSSVVIEYSNEPKRKYINIAERLMKKKPTYITRLKVIKQQTIKWQKSEWLYNIFNDRKVNEATIYVLKAKSNNQQNTKWQKRERTNNTY